MKLSEIKTPVSTLHGAGNATVKALSNLNIFTIGDLLSFYPKDYEDRTKRISLSEFKSAKKVHTAAKVISHEYFGYGKMKTLKIVIEDTTAKASLIAFNRSFLEKSLPVGSIISVTGSFEIKYNELQSSSFEANLLSQDGKLEDFENCVLPDSGIIPIYHLTQGITQKAIKKLIFQSLSQYSIGIDDEIPQNIISKRNLLQKKDAIKKIHLPQNLQEAREAEKTLIYEELYNFQITMLTRAQNRKGILPEKEIQSDQKPLDFSPSQTLLLNSISFALTKDQISVINRMNSEIDRGYKERTEILRQLENSNSADNLNQQNNSRVIRHPFTMQRLLQGDVGCGKTLTALFAALRVIDWGGQVAFMAPTEILSRQHAENISRLLKKTEIQTAFLTSNVKSAGRKTLLKELKSGNINILIGTHSLFSSDVIYKDLQLAIIDEQHRFGVLQRQSIVEKGKQLFGNIYASPHLLMMSATPIPQTLALTAFGDLDISTIKTLPSGRKPVMTYLVSEEHKTNAFNAVRQELDKGHQAYFVYPAIEEGDNNAESAFAELSKQYFSNYKCAVIHSRVPEEQQSRILDDFNYGKIQLLFATTVVEVGVDCPNATCMVIAEADRFGLSQLHQLRGRVGRGNDQGYCFLIFRKNITENGIARMKILRETTDGFIISEQDLKLRGPGEITGTIQSGALQLGIADLERDFEILQNARDDALETLKQHN
ncbi:MAG: ATP-dependent DNA helicase RecG [Treponema sp.]|nr:ATP-dependent DNA helicase RecG [Candidatus Treponema merdequi]